MASIVRHDRFTVTRVLWLRIEEIIGRKRTHARFDAAWAAEDAPRSSASRTQRSSG